MKVLRNIAAVLLILVGIISGFLPFLQGWLFIVAGIAISDFDRKQVWLRWLASRKLTKKLLGQKLSAKLLKLGSTSKNRDAAAAAKTWPETPAGGLEGQSATLPASDREPKA